jgi:catalase-peroxidase
VSSSSNPASSAESDEVFEGRDRRTGAVKWTASRVDLIFGSNSQLRALVNQTFASWNQISEWLRRFDMLRQAGWTETCACSNSATQS